MTTSATTIVPLRGKPLSAAAFIGDRETEATVQRSLSDLGFGQAHIERGNIDDAIALGVKGRTPSLLLVDVSGTDDPMLSLRKLSDVCDPDTAVVVIGERNDIALYRNMRELGISEYFYKPVLSDLLTRACNAALGNTDTSPSQRGGKLIVVIGVRGGVGATTIATNVAWHLAEGTQRRVALVDLDLLNGDVALQLDAQPSHALKEALDHPSRIDSLFVDRAVVHVTQRLDVLASLEPIGEAVLPSDDAATRLIAALQQRYRYVIVDIPATIVPSLPKLMHAPGTLVLVSDGTLASARDVGRWRALLSDETRDRTLLHVMNMQGMSGDLPESEWAAAFGHTPDVVIPYDRRVPIAVNEGRPAILTSRSLKGGLLALFRQIAGESEASPPSILERLFGQ